jgi:16S rRNA (adenine1518-N6/adenine1519-N6)-dimethyltransferase
MQLEVAERVVATPKRRDYGYLSVASQYFARPEIELRIPPEAFRPAPKVWSALVALQFPGAAAELGMDTDGRSSEAQAFLAFVQRCFAQKRKTLANNLRAMLGRDGLGGDEIARILRVAEIPAGARTEELSVEELVRLYRIVTLNRAKDRI